MSMILFIVALIVYVIICGVLVALILMQEGKGGGLSGVMGASMGETFCFGGASKQVRRYTSYCATAFLVLTVILTFLAEATFRGNESRFVGSDKPAASAPAATTEPAPAATEAAPAATEAAPAATKTAPAGTEAAPNPATPGQVTPAPAQ